jgi:DNA-binding transcriptional MerR regulator
MDDVRLTIGQVAARTGLPVRTIRYWSDIGAVPPAGRTARGYRLYDAAAVVRLELVATLRELGVGLEETRRLLNREVTVTDVAHAHMAAIDAQIRTLRLRRAVLGAVAERHATPEEMTLVNRFARLSAQERQRIIDDFMEEVVGDAAEGLRARLRDHGPVLPDDPTPEQVEAWVELAELLQAPGFRRGVRLLAGYTRLQDTALARRIVRGAHDALAAGIDPESEEGGRVAARILDGVNRDEVTPGLRIVADPRAIRYWELIGVINGWPPYPDGVPDLDHQRAGVRAHEWLVRAINRPGALPG